MNIQSILTQTTWRVIHDSRFSPKDNALASFAVDDTLCEMVGSKQSPAVARSWIHTNTIVLGIQDSRLPNIREGISYLKQAGWNVIVRNSGGLAVVLDEGVYNLSLILHEKENHLSIDEGFETMVALLRLLLAHYDISFQTGEIVGSYCPGRYDLSVNGKKFAGISQRRIRGGTAVQVYLCLNGNGSERARVIQRFYELASGNDSTLHPPIIPETMASLEELSQQNIRNSDINVLLIQQLKQFGNVVEADLNESETALFQTYYKRVVERNKKLKC